MKALTRDAILQSDDLETKEVEVPEWGGTVIVRCMTGKERDQFEAGSVEVKGTDVKVKYANMRARLVALSCIDKEGKRLFAQADVEALGAKNAKAIGRLFDAAQALSGLTKKDVKELAGDLKSARNGDSTSDSPGTLESPSVNS